MTNHEFLDKALGKERSTFADGTAVTVGWDAKTADIKPDVKIARQAVAVTGTIAPSRRGSPTI